MKTTSGGRTPRFFKIVIEELTLNIAAVFSVPFSKSDKGIEKGPYSNFLSVVRYTTSFALRNFLLAKLFFIFLSFLKYFMS